MVYFTTNLSFNLLVKEFSKLTTTWRSYRQNWLIVSYNAPFALHICPQRCIICQIRKITCVLWTETVTSCCNVIGRLTSAYYQQISNCCRPVLIDRLTPSATDQLLMMYSIMLRHLCLCYSSCVQSVMGLFLYGCCKHLFVNELNYAYFTRQTF